MLKSVLINKQEAASWKNSHLENLLSYRKQFDLNIADWRTRKIDINLFRMLVEENFNDGGDIVWVTVYFDDFIIVGCR